MIRISLFKKKEKKSTIYTSTMHWVVEKIKLSFGRALDALRRRYIWTKVTKKLVVVEKNMALYTLISARPYVFKRVSFYSLFVTKRSSHCPNITRQNYMVDGLIIFNNESLLQIRSKLYTVDQIRQKSFTIKIHANIFFCYSIIQKYDTQVIIVINF